MSWAAVIAGGAALVGGVVESQGAKKAAGKAAAGSDAAAAEAARQFDTVRGDNLGRINIGNQAFNTLGSIYGYSPNVGAQPNALAGSTPYNAPPVADGGFFNSGPGAALNPWSVTSKLGGAGKILDPAGGLFGNLFSGHGDEKRNLDAFTKQNPIYDLGNGMLSLADGTQFSKDKIQDVAGAWYGATYAPDGDQAGWQQKYGALIQKPQGANVATGTGASDGVNQGFGPLPGGTPGTAMTAPDYSAFYKSPDYTFRKQEGMTDIGNSFSASGGAKSGNALKALAEFNSNLAAGGFNDYFSHQATLAGLGANATSTSAGAGLATGQVVGNALQNSADSRASGVAGSYNALGAGFSGLTSSLGDYLQKRKNPYLGTPSSPYNYSFPG